MAELDVSHFRTIREPDEASPDVSSVEAPQKPEALSQPSVELPEQIEPTEIVGPSDVAVIPKSTPSILRRIDFEGIQSREQLMQELNGILPLNEFNLPRYVYRADLLDYRYLLLLSRQADGKAIQDTLANAIQTLDYTQGFPTYPNGMPFWSRAEYESKEAFDAFLQYLEQPGARTFHGMGSTAPEILLGYFHIYMWAHRARAYDMFQQAHHQRQRMVRIMRTEDNHYLEAEKMVSAIAAAINGKSAEDLAGMDADKLVSMYEKTTRIQRIAVGLPANGGIDESKAPQNTSVEVTMRTIAKKSGQDAVHDDAADIDLMLQDVETLSVAQEFIVKVNKQ